MVYLFVGCGELCLQIGLLVRWLGVMFGIGFALKRTYGGSETHPDWLATEEAAAVEAVLWW